MKKLFFIILACYSLVTAAQENKEIDKLIPWESVNQTFGKPAKTIMGIGASVNINITADLTDLDACASNSISSNGLQIALAWYNTNDETGKFMLDMLKDLGGIEQDMESFIGESGFEKEDAREEEFSGGKLWITTSQKECINELTGPTGKTQFYTHMRYFLFKGTTIAKIEISFFGKPEKAKEILTKVVATLSKFDFSVYKNTLWESREGR